jgi:hypothetical protein
MRRSRIAVLTAATAVLASGAFAASASALFHDVRVSEVHEDAGGGVTGDYAELQMFSAGQNALATHYIRFLDADGMALAEYPLPNVPNGESQRTVLVGNTGVPGADFTNAGVNVAASGGVCWNETNGGLGGIDCVIWGAFTGSTTPPSSPAGSPAAPAGLGAGQSLQRSLAPGCPTLLEAADDTNNSLTDFAIGPPSPRGNSVAPTEKPCTPAAKKKKCKKKKKKKKSGGSLYAAKKKKCKKKKKKK